MLNANKANKPPVRLPALQAMPTEELISQLLRTLQQNPGRLVVLPWTPASENKTMCLAVSQQAASRDLTKRDGMTSAGEPEWTLFRGLEPQGNPIWRHTTADTTFILNLLLAETTFTGLNYQATQPGPPKGFGSSAPGSGASSGSNQAPNANSGFGASAAGAGFGAPGAQGGQGFGQASQPFGSPGGFAPQQQPAQSQTESPAPNNAAWGMNLSGNVSDVDLTSVLQSISICKMVGKLEVNDSLKAAELYFDEGVLVHAIGQECVLDESSTRRGDTILLDLLTWDKGTFSFHSALKTSERSVTRRLEGMLMEGAALRDYSKSLADSGFTMQVPLVKVNAQINESQFEQMIKQGIPIELATQKAFYLQIGNGTSTETILSRLPMPKTVWLPIIFNLINCKIIRLEDSSVQRAPRAAGAIQLDAAALESAYHDLLRPETQLLSYPLFLFFLTQEFARYKKTGMPFSVAVFELKNNRNGVVELLSNPALKQFASQIEASMRDELVFVSHFGTLDFAMLLPCANSTEAEGIAQRLYGLLHAIELDGVPDPNSLQFAIGTASLPEHCQDIESLLNLAVQRRHRMQ